MLCTSSSQPDMVPGATFEGSCYPLGAGRPLGCTLRCCHLPASHPEPSSVQGRVIRRHLVNAACCPSIQKDRCVSQLIKHMAQLHQPGSSPFCHVPYTFRYGCVYLMAALLSLPQGTECWSLQGGGVTSQCCPRGWQEGGSQALHCRKTVGQWLPRSPQDPG